MIYWQDRFLSWLLFAAHKFRRYFQRELSNSYQPMPIIVGSPRSGTTLLRLMLDAHQDLAIPPETGFIIPAMRLWGIGRAFQHLFFETLTHFPPDAVGWHDFGIPPSAFWHELAGIEPFSVSAGLRCFYQMYAARFDKPRGGDKTPVYGRYLRAIEQLLPEAYFIHIIRDGRDAALLLRSLWFSPGQDLRLLAKNWRRDVSIARAQGRRCQHYLEIQYENLILDPPTALQRICAFCQLDYDPNMIKYFLHAPERLQEHRARVRADGTNLITVEQRLAQQHLTAQPPDPSRIFSWKNNMSPLECRQFE